MHHRTARIRGIPLLALAIAAGAAPLAMARIKLVALPERAATVIRLDNPQATLIEEERVLTLQEGVNKVDFSWKAVSLDVDSIRLTVLEHPGAVTLLNVSYPPDEDALVWEIASDQARQENVRISYLLANIDRLITYKAVADKAETRVDLKSFLVLRNFSGEDFDSARVLLDYGEAFDRGIQHEETKQLLFLAAPAVPITKIWTFDAAKLPWDPEQLDENVGIPVSYRIENTRAAGLGNFALWGGKARLFQDDGHESTIFLGEDAAPTVPVGEKLALYIGDSRDIVVTQRKMTDQQIHIRRNKGNQIVLYDTDEEIHAKIENFKDSPAVLTMLQHIPGPGPGAGALPGAGATEWKMVECNLEYTREDADTLKFEIVLPPRTEKGPGVIELKMHYQRLNVRP